MKDECFAALEKYRAGMSIADIARTYHVTSRTVHNWLKAAVNTETEKQAQRRKTLRAKAKADEQQRCAHCQWNSGTGVCVLPRCFARREA